MLYKRYFPRLREYLLKKYQTSTLIVNEVDEICQDVFYSFYQNIDKFQEKCSVKTWLFNIAHNKTADYFQKAGKEHVSNEEKSLEEETEETLFSMGIETSEREEKIFCLAECIGKALKKSDVQGANCLIALIFSLQKPSIEEIAKEIGISPKKAKAFLNRCKRKLKNRPDCLTALTLFHALEFFQSKLATELAKKPNAVGVFLHDCRKKLKNDINFKNCCKECGYQPEE